MKKLARWANKNSFVKVLSLFCPHILSCYLHSYSIVLIHPLELIIRSNNSEDPFRKIVFLLATDGSMNSFLNMVTYCMESGDVT
jgi:hypothetical protein